MTILAQALALASRGFHVFPIRDGEKLPAIKDFPNRASRDPAQLSKWFLNHPNRNLGISTSRFGDNEALVVIDVDVKKGKHGDETLLELELDGFDVPPTCQNVTPTGGSHLIFRCNEALRQGADTLGSGLDVRSRGGYIVAPGSQIEGKAYALKDNDIRVASAPEWLVTRLGVDAGARRGGSVSICGVDPERAADRAIAYLAETPGASLGSRGSTAYKVAAQVKNFGCTQDEAIFLMDLYWNHKCDPPMPDEDLEESVDHAYRYSRDPQGSDAPEAIFEPVQPPPDKPEKPHPFAEINREYAFIKTGAYILQETTDEDGEFITERLTIVEFNAWFANRQLATGKEKPRPISQHWIEWAGRRQYDGVVFAPEQNPGPRWYNLWRGFTVKPSDKANHPALDLFLEHALKNCCNGDKALFRYLMGYLAHMIQKPYEKPLVALVFKGAKGTGKNALIERVGALLGPHFLVADDDRYLLGNFNSHLESNLCFVLDEASWAGDKRAEGKLKGLITGKKRMIEHKGKEARSKKSLSRIVVLGNEDWVVPATWDERRYAVFAVGDGRRQDRKFFIDMREGMEAGGYSHLLRYLLDFDLTGIDVNDAPNTKALLEQKLAGLEPLEQWWRDCLDSGQIAEGDWGGEWPDVVPTNRLRDAYHRWARKRNIKGRLEEEVGFGRTIKKLAPSMPKKKARPDDPTDKSYAFFNPGLERLRADWVKFIGGEVEWPD